MIVKGQMYKNKGAFFTRICTPFHTSHTQHMLFDMYVHTCSGTGMFFNKNVTRNTFSLTLTFTLAHCSSSSVKTF